jgi:hypothetical protein
MFARICIGSVCLHVCVFARARWYTYVYTHQRTQVQLRDHLAMELASARADIRCGGDPEKAGEEDEGSLAASASDASLCDSSAVEQEKRQERLGLSEWSGTAGGEGLCVGEEEREIGIGSIDNDFCADAPGQDTHADSQQAECANMDFVAPTAETVAQTRHHAPVVESDLTAGETIPMTPVGPKTGFARGGLGASESLAFDDDCVRAIQDVRSDASDTDWVCFYVCVCVCLCVCVHARACVFQGILRSCPFYLFTTARWVGQCGGLMLMCPVWNKVCRCVDTRACHRPS